jgi:HKD family nuclease
MNVEIIPQLGSGYAESERIGDRLVAELLDANVSHFRFAVAFMRLSGWQRIASSIQSLIDRGGDVTGAVGVDQRITSVEALEAIHQVSPDSTVFYTTSSLIFHPKMYVFKGRDVARIVIGSSNLTREGLFRNVEVSAAIDLDLTNQTDASSLPPFEGVVDRFLDTTHPNVKRITPALIQTLEAAGLVGREGESREPTPSPLQRPASPATEKIQRLFPPLQTQVPPPSVVLPAPRSRQTVRASGGAISPGMAATFIMQLSPFDSSHRTGVKGTTEILIPHDAVPFFPGLSNRGEKYPSAYFNVMVNTTTGSFRSNCRLWYYETRATGTRIDEYRLRVDHKTIDQSTPGGGDLLVISKLPPGSPTPYEVTILPRGHPNYAAAMARCTRLAALDKVWGLA